MRLLIVKLSALGDVVQTLPSLTLIKNNFPDFQIDWVVDERNAEIIEGHPYIDRLLIFSKKYLVSIKRLRKFVKELRKYEYEAVIDYQGLFKSGIIVRFSKAKYKIGFSNYREGSPLFYNFILPPYDFNLHAVKRYIFLTTEVLKILNINKSFEVPEEIPHSVFSKNILENNLNFIKKPYIVFIPSARWMTKWWPLSYWERLVEDCEELGKDFDIFITGSLSEVELKNWAEKIERKYSYVYSLVGKLSLKELANLIKNSQVVVSVDTGPMHIASALRKPTVALFGPTSPERTGPWGGTAKIIRSSSFCSPCFNKKCKDVNCMKEIKPEEVKKALYELLDYSL